MTLHYDMPLYRPPAEADHLIIQVSLGCSFNQCSFCSMYRSKQYMQRPFAAIDEDIQAAARSEPDTRRVFLADGDALSLPTDQLLLILDSLATALPKLSRISSYATPANILAKSMAELISLKERGLTLLYLGIETGSELILKKRSPLVALPTTRWKASTTKSPVNRWAEPVPPHPPVQCERHRSDSSRPRYFQCYL